MSYTTSDLVSALSGGSNWRERALPESKDFATWLGSAYTPTQTSLMASIIDFTKDALLSKALTDRALMQGKRYG